MRSMWKVAGVLPSKDSTKRIIRMGNDLSINWCVNVNENLSQVLTNI